MISPALERCALLRFVCVPVVDPGDASLVAADMVEDRLDNVRLDTEVAHARGDGSPDVMEHERGKGAYAPVQTFLAP